MPACIPTPILTSLNNIYRFADCFVYQLERFPEALGPSNHVKVSALEEDFAAYAIGLIDALNTLREAGPKDADGVPHLPRHVRNALDTLERLFRAAIERWGSNEVIGPESRQYVKERFERYWREVDLPFYQALVDWCESPDADPDRFSSNEALWAMRELGLRRTRDLTNEEGRRLAWQANDRRWLEPAIGAGVPSFTEDEFVRFRTALGEVADHVGHLNADEWSEFNAIPPSPSPPSCALEREHGSEAPTADTTPSGDGIPPSSPALQTLRKRTPRGFVSLKIRAALDALAAKGEWGATMETILTHADVSKSRFYDLIRDDPEVKLHWNLFQDQRLGKRPARPDDL